jgi:hypothetical protein
MLKVIVLAIIDPIALEMMRPARGLWMTILRGMMGRGSFNSTQMNRGKQMLQITREETTKG